MKWILKGLLMGICFVGFVLGISYLVMWLWNMLIPQIFAGPLITYTQALGLLVLTRLLVGRGGWHGGGGGWGHKRGYWKKHMREKMERMSPEEREKYMANMKGKCGWYFKEEMKKEEENPQ